MSKIMILETRDYRGTLNLQHKGEVMVCNDEEVVKQLVSQGLVKVIQEGKEVKKTVGEIGGKVYEVKHMDSIDLTEKGGD